MPQSLNFDRINKKDGARNVRPAKNRKLNYTSTRVLRNPVTRSPSFHCPRFFRISTRSNRFITLRLAPSVDAPLKLRCCDIKIPSLKRGARIYHKNPETQLRM